MYKRQGHVGGRGGVTRPIKRARVAVPQSKGGGADESAKTKPGKGPVDNARKQPPPESGGGGFLGDLLGSLSSNAGGIASGKEHDFRQGLRGGEVRLLFERSEFLIATCKKKKTDRLSDVCTHNLLVLVWKNCLGSSVGYQRAPGWF